MSNMYDALERARREAIVVEPSLGSGAAFENRNGPTREAEAPDMEHEMIALYHVITASLPDDEHRSVLLLGSRTNEGTSTIARELARTVSLRMEKNVLLVDLDRSRPDLHVYAHLKPDRSIDEVVKTGCSVDQAMCQVEDSSLYVMPLFPRTTVTSRMLEYVRRSAFWEPLKERFDLIIVDSPPVTRFPDGPGIVSRVDGVILVVEAEKTRWEVALNTKEKILQGGGKILGIVFNKRRFYIPGWIYRRT